MAIQITVMSLDFESFEQPVTRVFEKSEITLGRHQTNDLVLDRPEVSGIHARLRVKANGSANSSALYITDLGSANGTMVENSALKAQVEVAILPNQRLIIGTYLIKPSVIMLAGHDSAGEDSSQAEAAAEESAEESRPIEEVSAEIEAAADSEEDSVNEIESAAVEVTDTDERDADVSEEEEEGGAATHDAPDFSSLSSSAASPASAAGGSAAPSAPLDPSASSFIVFVDGSSHENLDFIARELFTLGGKILHKGAPLAGVRIEAGDLGERTTGADGEFSFGEMPEGTSYGVKVEKNGFIFDLGGPSAGEIHQDIRFAFTATQLFEITGTVKHRGKPLPGVQVDGGPLGVRHTDDNGLYTFADIPEGTSYRLALKKDKFLFDKNEVAGEAGPTDPTPEVSVRELFALRGKVIHRGKPMGGVEVDGGHLGKVTTGSDGEYVFENVPEGAKYILTASKDGFVFGTIKSKDA